MKGVESLLGEEIEVIFEAAALHFFTGSLQMIAVEVYKSLLNIRVNTMIVCIFFRIVTS